MRTFRSLFLVAVATSLIAGFPALVAAETAVVNTTRISTPSDGIESGSSFSPAISADGNTIVFGSFASDLVAGDTNAESDIFAYDVATATITRVSVASDGTQANERSFDAEISADGGTIIYGSRATNLVPGDTNGFADVFAYDVATATTTRVSVASDGTEADGVSDVGAVTPDGSIIVYTSTATNLVAEDTNAERDVFTFAVGTGETSRISVATDGTEANNDSHNPAISADGATIAYSSGASNLVPNDSGSGSDVFAYDVAAATTTRISVAADGGSANNNSYSPSISADGGSIVFQSSASNITSDDTNALLSDVFVFDVATGATTMVTRASNGAGANGASAVPTISADGTTIVFHSEASDLVVGDSNGSTDVFVYDFASDSFTRVSIAANGAESDGDSTFAKVTANGGTTVYKSDATNLVSDDPNTWNDVFVTVVNRSPQANHLDVTVAEDVAVGTSIATVAVLDPDDDSLTFEISAGNDAGLFAIGTGTGVITNTAGLDYESAASHSLTVTVSDGVFTDTAIVTVNVTDVYEVDPDYNPFDDDDGSIFEADIEWLAHHKITAGCGVRLFCPTANVTRGQMAAFLTRALDLPAASQDYFLDDAGSIFEDSINRVAEAGITKGCNPSDGNTNFCPTDNVTRGQMAAFLVRALGYTDDGGGNLFDDDDTSIFESAIDKLATAGVTRGCNPADGNTNFCPTDNVTRGQMAAFLKRALDS